MDVPSIVNRTQRIFFTDQLPKTLSSLRDIGDSEGHSVLGKPRQEKLSAQEAESFEVAGVHVPLKVMVYPKFKLKGSGRIIDAENSSRSTKR